ncbi:putative protein N(5)-glutamine methyltransferase [Actinosynnema sp. NPDC053489]|uniref:putative protein N(5)-glutamine methyltransferase n=1 Tax=Actinosynnema sp. NPDC053489 TaxID=3363916 RepID=UPI0037C6F375
MVVEVVARLRAAGCVFAEDEARVLAQAARDPDELAVLTARRVAGLPLEHVVGWAEFCGSRVVVEPGVFVPRRRTEFLVRVAVSGLRPGAVVVDLCCGSGAVGAAVVDRVPGVRLHAVDVDPVAVACARRNVGGHEVHLGDLYEPLPVSLAGRVDVVVANAPYVPSGAIGLMPSEAREHEPLVALDGGVDGLDVQRRVVAGAVRWLAPGGRLLVETGARQAAGTVEAFARGGLRAEVLSDEELSATVVVGSVPAGAVRPTAPSPAGS